MLCTILLSVYNCPDSIGFHYLFFVNLSHILSVIPHFPPQISENFESASEVDDTTKDNRKITSNDDSYSAEYSFDDFEDDHEDLPPPPPKVAVTSGYKSTSQPPQQPSSSLPSKQRLYANLKSISPLKNRPAPNPIPSPSSYQSSRQPSYNNAKRTTATVSNSTRYQPKVDTIQTSLALEEIGREVIKLRNDRMAAYKERLNIANEKKDRALARRLKYENDMQMKTDNINLLESKLATMTQLTENLKTEISDLQEERSSTKSTLEKSISHAEYQSNEMQKMKQTIANLESANSTLLKEQMDDKLEWEKEKIRLQQHLRQAEAKVEVLESSQAEMEQRFELERQQLPEKQQALIDEKFKSISEKEALLISRENQLKSEEQKRLDSIDQLRKELFADVQEMRRRADESLENEKKLLHDRSKIMEEEKNAVTLQAANEKYALEAKSIDLIRRESVLAEAEKALTKKQTDLEISIKTMEPQLNSLKYEIEQANNSKRDAEAYWQKVRAQADNVLIAENEILAKERDMFSLADKVSRKREELIAMKKKIQSDINYQNSILKSLSGDRFTIYECAMVITSEISHARQTLVKNEDRIMKASEGSAAEGFMLQDSLRNLDRTLTKLNRVIKSLADTKVVKDPAELDESTSSSSIKSTLNLDEIPQIDIGKPHTTPLPQDQSNFSKFLLTNGTGTGFSNNIYEMANVLDSSNSSGGGSGRRSIWNSSSLPNGISASTEVKISIESATQSLLNLKDLSTKFGITV